MVDFELSLSFTALAFVELVPAAAVAAADTVAELTAFAFCEWPATALPGFSPLCAFDVISLLFALDVMPDVCGPFALLPPF